MITFEEGKKTLKKIKEKSIVRCIKFDQNECH
jgi:hypothetical protein